MPVVELETWIAAPPERVFDMARDIGLHLVSMAHHRERAVGGATSGLIRLGESVTWRARHFGVPLTLTSRVVEFDRPRRFRDVQERGPFAHFDHVHAFERVSDATLMRDRVDYASPLGPIGRLADAAFVQRAVAKLIAERANAIKEASECATTPDDP